MAKKRKGAAARNKASSESEHKPGRAQKKSKAIKVGASAAPNTPGARKASVRRAQVKSGSGARRKSPNVPRAVAPVTRAALYNRAAAVAYARGYWTRVATDGYLGSTVDTYYKVPLDTTFIQTVADGKFVTEVAREPNGQQYPLRDLDDCAHFLSCCLGKPPGGTGGGFAIPSDFPNGPYGILSANKLFEYLDSKKYLRLVAVKVKKDPTLLAQLEEGDLIFYWKNQLGRYHHVAMYMADAHKRITCHTYCRSDQSEDYDQSWNSVNGTDLVTFAKVIG